MSRPTVCFLTPTVSTSPLRPFPSAVYSFTSLTFILPASPRLLFLCVSPPELCSSAARADSFDLKAVHVVEIRGPAALPSRRSRNGALARENKPLFSAAGFFFGWTDRWRGEGAAVSGKISC